MRLGAEPELLSIVGAYGDTLTDEDVLLHLKKFNETGSMYAKVICRSE
jgi:hypothetical protein